MHVQQLVALRAAHAVLAAPHVRLATHSSLTTTTTTTTSTLPTHLQQLVVLLAPRAALRAAVEALPPQRVRQALRRRAARGQLPRYLLPLQHATGAA